MFFVSSMPLIAFGESFNSSYQFTAVYPLFFSLILSVRVQTRGTDSFQNFCKYLSSILIEHLQNQ